MLYLQEFYMVLVQFYIIFMDQHINIVPIASFRFCLFLCWENFVFATLAFADFAYATLEFDISLLPLLAFDNTSQMPLCGKSNKFLYHFCHS